MKVIGITKAEYIDGFKVYLGFSDSTAGTVDLKGRLPGPILEPLNEVHFFKNFTLNNWTIEWPNGADLAPEFLYDLTLKAKPELQRSPQ